MIESRTEDNMAAVKLSREGDAVVVTAVHGSDKMNVRVFF